MSKTRFFTYAFAALLVSSILSPSSARAAETSWVIADNSQARLISLTAPLKAALEVNIPPGWHTYWRVSGDAGLPPVFDWSKSENVKSVDVSYPYPTRFDEQGIITFGYETGMLFPLKITPVDASKPVKLDLSLDFMVCREICVPQNMKLSLDTGGAKTGDEASILKKAAEKIPQELDKDISIDTIVAGPGALAITATSETGFNGADIFPVMGESAFTAKPQIAVDPKDPKKAIIKIPKNSDADDFPKLLAGHSLDVTMVIGGRSVQKTAKF